ncbi:MAG: sigma-54-dependent Fis family transcriptional regulator [Gemmatimonadetes bacterium]|nr:sigma-54-dependent Fis family transcriptional regulator [Gemmatimonadota bacterium]
MSELVLITTQDLEPAVRVRDAFRDAGFGTELLTPGEHVDDAPGEPVLVILTGNLGEKQSRRLVREAGERDQVPVIGLLEAGHDRFTDARAQYGLSEALLKPIEPQEVVRIGRRLMDRRQLRRITGIIGETDAMVETLERIVQIAPVNSTVLLTGESGTGKERVARGIHALSSRRHRPFIATNVAALPETLLEAELFGHEKGAFTGAIGQRKGFFELAHKGTLFLDEIGEMPPNTQVKLLRALEEQRFRRLGGETELEVDVRVIAATNQALRELVEIGRFRRDLYFRLNVLRIDLPPLRQRRDDIPLLVASFIAAAAREHDRPAVTLSQEAMAILLGYDWPGNVRELKNLIESMVVLSPGGVVRPEDIPPEIRQQVGRSRMLPVPIPRADVTSEQPAPELEFIFRTLVQLRMDVEDLRRQFDDYREAHPELGPAVHRPFVLPGTRLGQPGPVEILAESLPAAAAEDTADEHDVVVYRPGMTLQDLEKNAIIAALREVAGNRRKAAEMLGMGERTLYRKIKDYGIPL